MQGFISLVQYQMVYQPILPGINDKKKEYKAEQHLYAQLEVLGWTGNYQAMRTCLTGI